MRFLNGLLVLALALATTGCFGDDRPRISIEFGADPELFAGKDVTVDSVVVGKLEKTGEVTRISFPVDMGVHEVCIDVPEFGCEPARVEVQMKGQKVRLLAMIGDYQDAEGRQVITFQPM